MRLPGVNTVLPQISRKIFDRDLVTSSHTGSDQQRSSCRAGTRDRVHYAEYLHPPGGKSPRRGRRHPCRCFCSFKTGVTIAHTGFDKSRVGAFSFCDWCVDNGCSETRHPSIRMSAFAKRVACPEGVDLGFGGFPQQAKIRLGSTQTLLATIIPNLVQ